MANAGDSVRPLLQNRFLSASLTNALSIPRIVRECWTQREGACGKEKDWRGMRGEGKIQADIGQIYLYR